MRTYNFQVPRAERELRGGLGEPPSRFWRGLAVGVGIMLAVYALIVLVFVL